MQTVQRFAALAAVAVFTGVSAFALVEPKVGGQAPPFELVGSDGKTYRLADFKGKQAVVLAWFARAFSGG
jgi:peroxiredoxin Q/BCP